MDENGTPLNAPFRRNLPSRLLATFPFLIEILYWLLTYWPYQLLRAASALYIDATPERKALVTATARMHASQLLILEGKLGLAIEWRFQQLVLRAPLAMRLLSDLYLAHIAIGIAFLAYAYTYFPPARFDAVRRAIALDNLLAFPILSLWRCAPPRLTPAPWGFVDVLHAPDASAAGSAWAHNRFQLTLAAMPSLHFGTALLLGASTTLYARHTWLRVLAPLYPLLMLASVVATANHWVLDCAAGAAVVAAGAYANRVLLRLRPLEDWAFALCGVERPPEREDEAVLRKEWEV